MAGSTITVARARGRVVSRAVPGESVLRIGAGLLTGAAGVVHLVHASAHLRPTPGLGIGFLVVGWLQLVLGALALSRRDRRVLLGVVAVDVIAAGAWAASRTIGLPTAGVEAVGAADAFTAGIAFAAAVATVRLLAARPVAWQMPSRLAVAGAWASAAFVIAATTSALLAGAHLHEPAHHGSDAGGVTAEPGHDIFGHPHDGSQGHELFPQLDD